MNDNLRKAINVKAALKRKYTRCKNQESLSKYGKQRNLVNKLKKTSLKEYFNGKWKNKNSQTLWQTVRPFIPDKSRSSNQILYYMKVMH